MKENKRKFKHDCPQCIFLGGFEDPECGYVDLYWCINSRYRHLDSLLARYGELRGGDYLSSLPPEAFADGGTSERAWYKEILKRGEKAGLYEKDPSIVDAI